MTGGSAVAELRRAATDDNVPLAKLLRLAKVLATKLDLPEALHWINAELDGYMNGNNEELPEYRKLRGELKGLNRYHGWRVVHFEDPEFGEAVSQAPIGLAIGPLEEGIAKRNGGTLSFALSPSKKSMLLNAVEYADDVMIELNPSQLFGILDAVRNLVLNWSLELEKKGVVGDGLEFSQAERKEANTVTHQYFIQNAGVVGNVSDGARVENNQNAVLSLGSWRNVVEQIEQGLPLLPAETRSAATPIVADLKAEAAQKEPNVSKLRELGSSLLRITEGAAGNLAAAGIAKLLMDLMS
jgi:hypothetical protein